MKKAFLSAFLSIALCLNFPCIALAQEPTMPDLDGKSNEEAAALVNEYNAQVDAYNKQIDADYDQAVKEYNEALAYNEEAKKHNAQEDASVAQVNAANAAEQARVDAINEQLRTNYEKDLASYNSQSGSNAGQNTETPKYVVKKDGNITYYYDNDGNLLYKSVASDDPKDDIVTYENVGSNEAPKWSDAYNYNGKYNKRYVNFSIISEIGKATSGILPDDNDATGYSNKVFSTIANINDVSGIPCNFKDPGEGRNLINYLTEVNGQAIGLEECDTIIRSLATKTLDTWFNKANGNEAAGEKKMQISFADFPSTAAVFKALQTNGSVFHDPVTGQSISGSDINAQNYTLRWFSVKYQSNGWRVSGVLLKNEAIPAPDEPEYLVASLQSYSPQYMALKEAVAPIKGNYLSSYVFVPVTAVTQEEEGVVEGDAQPVLANDATVIGELTIVEEQAPAAQIETPAAETITDDETPLASGISSEEPSGSWALLNLICMILNILLLLIIPRNEKNEEDEESEESEVRYRTNALGIALALAAIIVFILTENVHLPMVIVDQWTPLMAAFAVGGIVTKFFSHKKVEDKRMVAAE